MINIIPVSFWKKIIAIKNNGIQKIFINSLLVQTFLSLSFLVSNMNAMYIIINNCANVDGWKLRAPSLIHDLAPLIDEDANGITNNITIAKNPYCRMFLSLKTSNGIATEININVINDNTAHIACRFKK